MIIDPTTNLGKLRLRCADIGDLPFLTDEVYNSVLGDTSDNLTKSTVICANYILGILSLRTHRKLSNLEIWGQEAFTNYRLFLRETIANPNTISGIYPIPYSPDPQGQVNPLIQFVSDWNNSYSPLTNSETISQLALYQTF